MTFCLLLGSCGVNKLNPEDFCEVSIEGAEGYAKASLVKKYSDLEIAATSNLSDKASDYDKISAALFADTIEFKIVSDKTTELKNGDVIEVEVNYNKDIAKNYGFAFSKDSFKYKIKDLEEAQPLNVFEGLSISYSGYSPKASFTVDTSGCSDIVRQYIRFDYENKPVANGDTIEIKASASNEASLLSSGYVFSSETKEFIVSGVEEGKSIDPFNGLVLEYSGISPNASISFNTSECDDFVKNNVSFKAGNSYYANGDKVNVTISYSESKANENGVVFVQEEKTYDVSGLPEFLSGDEGIDFSSVDEEFKNSMESLLADDGFYKGATISGKHVLLDVRSDDEYVITSMEFIPVKKMFFSAKNNENKIQNNHLTVWNIVITAEKTGSGSKYSTHDDIEIGKTVSATYLGEAYIQNVAINGDRSLNLDATQKKNANVSYISANGIYWNSDNKNKTVDSICEKWRSQNAADFNITITDY
ncbi:MAG: hypothetical protein ACI4JJ_01890 [Huintestinicola sp.]